MCLLLSLSIPKIPGTETTLPQASGAPGIIQLCVSPCVCVHQCVCSPVYVLSCVLTCAHAQLYVHLCVCVYIHLYVCVFTLCVCSP